MKRVLVVDDKEENLYYLQALLAGHGFAVDTARDGAEALAKARETPPDLIVSDLLMPVMDGFALLREWRGDNRLRSTPFIVYTATYTDPEDEQFAKTLGADAFIVKPAEPDDFMARVHKVVEGSLGGEPSAVPPVPDGEDDEEVLQLYTATLVRKLEKRTRELEEANRLLKRDVVERERTEAALEESEARYHSLFEHMMDGYAYCRAIFEGDELQDFEYLQVNEAFDRLTGLGDVVGKNVSEVIPDLTVSGRELFDMFGRVTLTGVPERRDVYVEAMDRWLSVAAYRTDPGSFVTVFDDITQRRESERAEAELRERLVLATESARIGIWDWDVVSDEVLWDRRMFELYGAGEDDPRGAIDIWRSAIVPEDRERADAQVAAALAGGDGFHSEYRVVLPDGEARHIETRGLLRRAADGSPSRMVGVSWDITARKRAEASLRDSEERFSGAFEHAPVGMALVAPDGRFLKVNRKLCELVGYSAAELLDLTFLDVTHPDDVDNNKRVVGRLLAGEIPSLEIEKRYVHKDGSVITGLLNVTVVRDGLGRVQYQVAQILDITERRRADLALRESEERFRRLLQDVPTVAVQGYAMDGTARYWNRASEQLYGYTAEEAIGRNLLDLIIPAEMHDGVRQAMREMAETGVPVPASELTLERKDGSPVTVYSSHASVRVPGRDPELFCIDVDLTERKQLEEQFYRAQRMESIGTLAGGIAHDLNNALGPIIMSLELLEMEFPDGESRELLDTVRSSAQRAADMVRQVLSFARGVDGRRMEVQVRHVLKEVEKIANETFLKSITVRASIPRDLWTVLGDPTQLHQVIMNLCVNGRDAMPGGGTLELTAENTEVDEQYAGLLPGAHPGRYVMLQVNDTGVGIPPDIIEKIFDPFFTTKELGQGTGLGLSTSLAIVNSHGGFMRVYSEPGKGSTFRVFLPASIEAGGEDLPDAPVELPKGNGELILVVDDEAAVREVTKQTLEAFGYRVMLASDGTEAVAVFGKRHSEIDAVITDMMMPVMDGTVTIQVLRKIDPDVRIIAASGLAPGSDLASLGVKHFLPKPYTATTLLTMLKHVLTGV
ncbi:MAG: PAS domain S-box protein [Gemmatimonadota bacterium]